jgi:hypothetical protein
MTTIEDIQLDTDYSQASSRLLLLNHSYSNQPGPSPVIVLSYASLLTFIGVCDNLVRCQKYIHDHKQKIITLCISDRKIIEWDNKINVTDDNIRKVYIFCNLFQDFLEMKGWNGCYRAQIQDVYLPNELEYNLLRLGVDYIRQIMPEFRNERGLYRKFSNHARELLKAIDNYFRDEIDDLDDPESVENV